MPQKSPVDFGKQFPGWSKYWTLTAWHLEFLLTKTRIMSISIDYSGSVIGGRDNITSLNAIHTWYISQAVYTANCINSLVIAICVGNVLVLGEDAMMIWSCQMSCVQCTSHPLHCLLRCRWYTTSFCDHQCYQLHPPKGSGASARGRGAFQLNSFKKKTGCLDFIGDYTLSIYMGGFVIS